jgi:hypothetical protein
MEQSWQELVSWSLQESKQCLQKRNLSLISEAQRRTVGLFFEKVREMRNLFKS